MDATALTNDEIIRECIERFRIANDAEGENRNEALTDKKFRNGEQWDSKVKDDRILDSRPCLTVNITDAAVRRVANACRENRPRIKVHPVGDGADIETAKVLDGLIRHIENLSGSDHSYDQAIENAIDGGWGYLGVESDYVDEKSFDQELKIIGFRNPFTCYADPSSQTPDGCDYNWFIETEELRRDEYKQRFGHLDPDSFGYIGTGDKIAQDWQTKESVRVARYWRVEKHPDTLHLMTDGSTCLASELPRKKLQAASGWMPVEGKSRPTVRKVVKCYVLTSTKILETYTWPGKYIPRVPVYGREMDINGKVFRKGMVRDLRDPARMFNYSETAKTEIYALQPKAPWLIADGQMEGNEAAWRDANRKPVVALPYKPVMNPDGTVAPPPQRQMPPPPANGFAEWTQSNQSNFMAVAGMPHDPGQDAKGEVVSGIALRRRQGISDISHFDFYDNFARSLRQLGRIIIDVIPEFYDTQRIQRIIREDGTPETITLNEKQIDPTTQAVLNVRNNTQVGRYDVTIETGPGYQTKREESTEAKLELLATPLGELVGKAAGDLIVRGMDFENSSEIADRLQAMNPVAQVDKKSDLPEKAQIMINGLRTQLQHATQMIQALQLEIKLKTGIEQTKQQHETQRLLIKEDAETKREKMRDATKRDDTHTRAVTAHDVAEINAASQLLNSAGEQAHEKHMAREMLKHGAQAENRAE